MRFLPYILLLLFLASCEDLVLNEEPENTPRSNFEFLWEQCDKQYAFFDYKGIDWDEVYDRYSPRVSDGISRDSLFRVLFAMLNELKDGHVNLISSFNVSRYDVRLLGQENIDERLVTEEYLGEDSYITGPLNHNFIADGKVGYVRYESFSGSVSNNDLSFIFFRYRNADGLIFDVRQNGGGSVTNVFRILNRLTNEKTHIYDSYIKSGPEREDFDGPQPAYLEPLEDSPIQWLKPVVVLTDRGTYSAGSFFALGALALDNCLLIGDTTGGGLGIPNGGQLPNGWTYRFSISRTLTPAGENYESGVPPDIRVLLRKRDVDRGVDTVIERAVEEILK